jgi:hypothetical protein
MRHCLGGIPAGEIPPEFEPGTAGQKPVANQTSHNLSHHDSTVGSLHAHDGGPTPPLCWRMMCGGGVWTSLLLIRGNSRLLSGQIVGEIQIPPPTIRLLVDLSKQLYWRCRRFTSDGWIFSYISLDLFSSGPVSMPFHYYFIKNRLVSCPLS